MSERQLPGEGEGVSSTFDYTSPVGFDRFVEMIMLMRRMQDIGLVDLEERLKRVKQEEPESKVVVEQ